MLWQHNRGALPIGRWTKLRVEDGALYGTPEFDEEDEEAMKVKGKVERGFLKAVSIGIDVLEFREDVEEDRVMPTVSKSSLYEVSFCDIGANRNAVKLYKNGELLNLNAGGCMEHLNKFKQYQNKKSSMKKIALLLALAETASETLVAEKVQELIDNNTALKKERDDLQDKVVSLTQKHQEDLANSLVESGISSGKIRAAEKETYLRLAKADFEGTKTLIEGMKPYKSLASGLGREGNEDKYKGWDFKRFQREAPHELARLRSEDPDRYNELFNAAFPSK